jgi:hypothetical protein
VSSHLGPAELTGWDPWCDLGTTLEALPGLSSAFAVDLAVGGIDLLDSGQKVFVPVAVLLEQ